MWLMLLTLAGLLIGGKTIAQEFPALGVAQSDTIFNSIHGLSGTELSPLNPMVQQEPEFPGGDTALMAFIQRNINYPMMERDNNIEGKVLLRFVIMEDGSIGSVKVVRRLSPGIDKEAVRVIKSLPKFKPAMQVGKTVKVYYSVPIMFSLGNYKPK